MACTCESDPEAMVTVPLRGQVYTSPSRPGMFVHMGRAMKVKDLKPSTVIDTISEPMQNGFTEFAFPEKTFQEIQAQWDTDLHVQLLPEQYAKILTEDAYEALIAKDKLAHFQWTIPVEVTESMEEFADLLTRLRNTLAQADVFCCFIEWHNVKPSAKGIKSLEQQGVIKRNHLIVLACFGCTRAYSVRLKQENDAYIVVPPDH